MAFLPLEGDVLPSERRLVYLDPHKMLHHLNEGLRTNGRWFDEAQLMTEGR